MMGDGHREMWVEEMRVKVGGTGGGVRTKGLPILQLPLAGQAASTVSRSRLRRYSRCIVSALLLAAAAAPGLRCCKRSKSVLAAAQMIVMLSDVRISKMIFT